MVCQNVSDDHLIYQCSIYLSVYLCMFMNNVYILSIDNFYDRYCITITPLVSTNPMSGAMFTISQSLKNSQSYTQSAFSSLQKKSPHLLSTSEIYRAMSRVKM